MANFVKPVCMDSNYITFNFFKKEISICQPLLLLKVCIFLYYGAGSFMAPFLTVLFKERGVSLTALSFMLMLSPIVQAFITTISGIVADKIGRAKPVFTANTFITMSLVLSIIFLPKIPKDDDGQTLAIFCDANHTGYFTVDPPGVLLTELDSCVGLATFKLHQNVCKEINYTRLNLKASQSNPTLYSVVNEDGFFQSWCHERPQCFVSCRLPGGSTTALNANGLLIAYSCIYVLFLSTFSTAYRMLDVTVMFMVKEHDSSFGHERFFAVLGMVLTSPLAGYIADVTAPPGANRNYTSALYFFIVLCALIMPFLYKMPMRTRPKGENMWRKAIELSKNPEVMAFFLLMIALGAGFNLVKNFLFWYLEGLNASSLLIGLITSINAFYGLPFLLTSHWWVKKLGAPQIFILGCVGYAINGIGYSLIKNPWYSLMLESTGILTYYLLWVAAVEYSHDVAPEGLTATVISIAGGIHFSVGKVTAGLIGKFVMNTYGGAIAFRFLAATTLAAGVLYSTFLCIRKRQSKKESDVNEIKAENAKDECSS